MRAELNEFEALKSLADTCLHIFELQSAEIMELRQQLSASLSETERVREECARDKEELGALLEEKELLLRDHDKFVKDVEAFLKIQSETQIWTT